MDALTDPMIASQMGRFERRIAELEAENAKLREAARAVLDTEYYLAGPELAALAALLEK